MQPIKLLALLVVLASTGYVDAQTPKKAKHRIVIDLAHKPIFWNDPAGVAGKDPGLVNRINYMTGEMTKTANAVDAELVYIKDEIKPEQLTKGSLLFIHIPSGQYTPAEVNAVIKFIGNGGAMFVVMDADYWSNLKQTNVNDLIRPFGIEFDGPNPDSLAGGSTKASLITPKPLKISYHGARIIKGSGTPFCFNIRTEKFPFGVYKEVKNGGKIIVMGDGMVSLYMTSWEGVNDYQCQEFMHDTFQWLLKR